MPRDILLLLPIAAIVVCMVLPVLPSYKRSSQRSYRSRPRRAYTRKVLLSRWLVVSLLVGTAATYLYPIAGTHRLLQGLLITAICMAPVLLFFTASFLFKTVSKGMNKLENNALPAAPMPASKSESSHEQPQAKARLTALTGQAVNIDTDAKAPPELNKPRINLNNANETMVDDTIDASPSLSSADDTMVDETIDAALNLNTADDTMVDETIHASLNLNSADDTMVDETIHASLNLNSADDTMVDETIDASLNLNSADDTMVDETIVDEGILEGQLDRVSQMVKNYDIGGKPGSRQSGQASLHERRRELTESEGLAVPGTPEVSEVPGNSKELSVLQTQALKKTISILKQDKRKLQRLVIAQQTALDAELQSHERSRRVAKEAVKVMRDSQDGQRVALKVARRERSERRRLEQKYAKVNRQLENALSTLAAQKKTTGSTENQTVLGGSPNY